MHLLILLTQKKRTEVLFIYSIRSIAVILKVIPVKIIIILLAA